MNRQTYRTLVTLFLLLLCSRNVALSDAATAVRLGDLPGGDFASAAVSISGDGAVAVGFGTSQAGGTSVQWDLATSEITGLTENPPFVRVQDSAMAISANGAAVVGNFLEEELSGGFLAYRRTDGGQIDVLNPLPTHDFSTAHDVSADGSVIVGSSRSLQAGRVAVLWENGVEAASIGFLPTDPGLPTFSNAIAVSLDGITVVGGSSSGFGNEGFVWTASTGMVGIGVLPGAATPSSRAVDVSSDGLVAVGFSFSESFPTTGEAIAWTPNGGLQPLGGVLRDGDFRSGATVVSDDGTVIFGQSRGLDDFRAFVWHESFGMRDFIETLATDFDLSDVFDGWSLVQVGDISADGLTIVGVGFNPDGNREAWAIQLDRPIGVPEPAGAFLATLAILYAAFHCRRLSR